MRSIVSSSVNKQGPRRLSLLADDNRDRTILDALRDALIRGGTLTVTRDGHPAMTLRTGPATVLGRRDGVYEEDDGDPC